MRKKLRTMKLAYNWNHLHWINNLVLGLVKMQMLLTSYCLCIKPLYMEYSRKKPMKERAISTRKNCVLFFSPSSNSPNTKATYKRLDVCIVLFQCVQSSTGLKATSWTGMLPPTFSSSRVKTPTGEPTGRGFLALHWHTCAGLQNAWPTKPNTVHQSCLVVSNWLISVH